MELKADKIPPAFIKTIPKGFRLIKRKNDDFLLIDSLFCPRGHNLIDESVRIHGEASIKLSVKISNETGFLFIDAFWGSHAKLFSFIPSLTKNQKNFVEGFCPKCDSSITEHFSCKTSGCDSEKSLLLILPGTKNLIHVCAKLGCPGHSLEIRDMAHEVLDSISNINYFGTGSDEFFGGI